MLRHSPILIVSTLATAFAVGLAGIAPAGAHAIWFAQRAKQTALIYGVGADDLDAVSRMKYLTLVKGYDENGSRSKRSCARPASSRWSTAKSRLRRLRP